MEYIYAAMLLHTANQKIDEKSVKKVLEAAGSDADDARIKALIAALEDVDIEEAMEKTAVAAAPAAGSGASAPAVEEAEEEEAEEEDDDEEKEEEAAAGLGALFG